MFARRWIVVPVALLSLAVMRPAQDTPESEVRAAILGTLAAWSAGDFDRLASAYGAETRGFLFGGAALVKGFNPAALQAAYEAGFRATFDARGLDVKVMGDAAIAVAYLDGTLTLPGGEEEAGSWRYSETRVKNGGDWKIVQYHFSKLAMPSR